MGCKECPFACPGGFPSPAEAGPPESAYCVQGSAGAGSNRPDLAGRRGLCCLVRCPAVLVESAQHPEFRTVMDLLAKLMEHEGCLVVLGVRAGDGTQRLPQRVRGQILEQALPERVGTFQDADGLRCAGRRRIVSFEARRLPAESQPLRIPDSSVALSEVPQPPRDRREGRQAR
jgi:hypothetical protein